MPRSLTFVSEGNRFSADLFKVDRTKLYGTVTVETRDLDGKRCALANLAIDGKTLVGEGGTASTYVNRDGDWLSRDDLQPVGPDGEVLPTVPSSFDGEVSLDDEVSIETYLDHSVRLAYRLKVELAALPSTLLKRLRAGSIYRFGFSYRGGVEHDPAFIMLNQTQTGETLWLLIATENEIEFVGLEQAAICKSVADQDVDEGNDDGLDFGML